ncbi:hypothetical protein BRPE64_ACDS13720 [Caballeronia insecticola]|uniref:Uncharacterized protein n=1 Tax=Caballeronia insecticola TaxID=758793 RepID=R4WVZ8_9BURK|nr:hypothetical protein BRPE64_ACDS13720 [Caballeronia insecticola]
MGHCDGASMTSVCRSSAARSLYCKFGNSQIQIRARKRREAKGRPRL